MTLAPDNPMTRVLSMSLWFQLVVFGLAIPGMIQVSDRSVPVAFVAGGAAMLLAAVAAGTLRRGPGFYLGWLTQVVGIALGVLTPFMYLMGGVFALLWVIVFVLGRRLASRTPAAP